MASLLLTMFILQVVLELVNKLGASTINDFLWNLYNKFPIATSKSSAQQSEMRREIVRLQRELNAVSAQDDFARWAKLRRQHDKAVADHDKLNNSLSSTRSTFDSRLTLARQIGISGLRLFLQSWYMKSPLFWIPKGWLPIYVEWLLAFPKAPTGSVSIQVWSAACGSVITMMGEAIGAAVVLVLRMVKGDAGAGAKKAPMPQPQKVGQPQKVPT